MTAPHHSPSRPPGKLPVTSAGDAIVTETDLARILGAATHAALAFRRTLGVGPQRPAQSYAEAYTAFDGPLPEAAGEELAVIEELVALASPGLHAMTGSRFFGWVIRTISTQLCRPLQGYRIGGKRERTAIACRDVIRPTANQVACVSPQPAMPIHGRSHQERPLAFVALPRVPPPPGTQRDRREPTRSPRHAVHPGAPGSHPPGCAAPRQRQPLWPRP